MTSIAIVGAGPAGLIAAETLALRGHGVRVYERMPSAGRKLLMAGRGGLNLTHSEDAVSFVERYGAASDWMSAMLRDFSPTHLRAWCEGLGQPIFVGSSGRVFPVALKAAPLLRAWVRRLESMKVRFAGRHRWVGWTSEGMIAFETDQGVVSSDCDALLLALGGASWPRLGTDGAWVASIGSRGIAVCPLRPTNCGVDVAWSAVFSARHEGRPLKRIALSVGGRTVPGELMVTRYGLEGGPVYALSQMIREGLDSDGLATLSLDLRPDIPLTALAQRVDGVPRGRSLANVLRQSAGLSPVAIGMVQEALHAGQTHVGLAALIKSVPVTVTGLCPIDRAISSAGGISLLIRRTNT